MSRNTIAVCIVKMDENFQSDSVKAITRRASERGLSVEIYNSFEDLRNDDPHDKGEESIFELIDYRHLYGIILFPEKIKSSRVNDMIIKYAKKHKIPIVSIDREIKDCISITFDYSKAFEKIVEHLITVHNCKSFYMMAGMRDNKFSDERIEAARNVIRKYGYELTDDDIGYGDFWELPTRTELNKYLDSGRPLPDAIISANDSMAMIICDELGKRDIRVPEDVIVTGFDGIEAEKYAFPRLTTAETDLESAGHIAVDSIMLCANGSVPGHIVVSFNTRFSQSCGCCPVTTGGVNGIMQRLYNELTMVKRFNHLMSAMLTRMSTADNILDMISLIEHYRSFFPDYKDIYVCLRRSEAMIDDELDKKLVIPDDFSDSKSAEICDRQMVLLYEDHLGWKTEKPLKLFRLRDVLPDRASVLTEYKNMVFLPLHIQDRVFGYVAVSLKPYEVDYNYFELEYFSRNLSQAMANVLATIRIKKTNESLRAMNVKLGELSETDYLTGVSNRRGFFKKIEENMKNGEYEGFLLASVDLNGLKTINDKFGHHKGDRAICAMADILCEMREETGYCARFGGDEFAFCAFYKKFDEGADVRFINELKKRVEEYYNTHKTDYYFSASAGAVSVRISEADNLDKLFKLADEKMYEDKVAFHRAHKEFDRRKAGS